MNSPEGVVDYYLNWTTTSYPTAFLFPVLPNPLLTLAWFFRLAACITILPVVILSAFDVVGWFCFKLVWRPLGYTSTIRFKDPEPSTRLTSNPPFVPSKNDSTRTRTSSRSRSRPRPATSRIQDEDLEPVSVPDFASSSSNSSPTISYTSELSPSPSRSPSDSPSSKHLTTLPLVGGALGLQVSPHSRRPRSDSDSSNSSASSIRRARAPSIGVEGPLFGSGEDLVTLNEEGSEEEEDDDDEGSPHRIETSESESESSGGGPLSMKSNKAKLRQRGRSQRESMGIPRGGPGFGFTGL